MIITLNTVKCQSRTPSSSKNQSKAEWDFNGSSVLAATLRDLCVGDRGVKILKLSSKLHYKCPQSLAALPSCGIVLLIQTQKLRCGFKERPVVSYV